MTKLAVFGATGATGIHLVAQALAGNHVVKALVRDEDKLRNALEQEYNFKEHDNLQIVKVNNIFDEKELEEPLKDVQVVMSTLGFKRGTT